MGREVAVAFDHLAVQQSKLFVDVDVAVQSSLGIAEFDCRYSVKTSMEKNVCLHKPMGTWALAMACTFANPAFRRECPRFLHFM
jgi:hypothetical protein